MLPSVRRVAWSPIRRERRIVEAITERIVVANSEIEIFPYYAPPIPKTNPPAGGFGGAGRARLLDWPKLDPNESSFV